MERKKKSNKLYTVTFFYVNNVRESTNYEKLKEFCARIDEHLANIAKYESEAKQSGEDLTEAFGGKGEGEA